MTKTATKFKVGQRVTWIGRGKVARLNGTAGKPCFGRVMEVNDDKAHMDCYGEVCLTVRPEHAPNVRHRMDALVPAKKCTVVA